MNSKSNQRFRECAAITVLSVSLLILTGALQSAGAAVPLETTPVPSSVTAGYAHACEIKSNGSIACWGSATEGNASPLAGTFTRLSSGWTHNCGIKTDGTLACWGFDLLGQATPPHGKFSEIAVGALHSCGIKTDGTLACWGDNFVGQASPPTGTFMQVTAGSLHSCALRVNGTVACWGENLEGRTDPPNGTFTQISTGNHHTCGVRSNGTVACWGSNDDNRSTPPGGTFTQVSAGAKHSCGIKTDGTVTCWGANDQGQVSAPMGKFTSVSAGGEFSCAQTTGGLVRCWGKNDYGQAPVLAINPTTLPQGDVGSIYHQNLKVTADMYKPLSPVFSLALGNLPKGLSLGNDGALTGTPTAAGSFDFKVTVVDANAFAAEQAFTIVIGKGPLLVQDTDISAQYGGWRGHANAKASGGTWRESNTLNDTASFNFKATSVTWIGRQGPDMGKALVSIDGVKKGTVDLYSASVQWQFKKTFDKLSNAKHTLVVKVLGTKNAKATDTKVSVDAFKVGATTSEDTAPTVKFNTWNRKLNAAASGGSYRTSSKAGAKMSFTFTGTKIEWVTAKGPKFGNARVLIDGTDKGVFDLYASALKWQVAIPFEGLSGGQHRIEIQVVGTKNTASKGTAVIVDALRLVETGASTAFSKAFATTIVAARAATIPVRCDDPNTQGVDEGVSALIQAINDANNEDVNDLSNHYGTDTLDLSAGCTYRLRSGYTPMPGTTLNEMVGLPLITSDIQLNGHGATITRDSSDQFIFLYVAQGGKLNVNDMTFTNAYSFRGSCIWNEGTLEVNDSVFSGNTATWSGPAIQNDGFSYLKNVTSTNNTSGYYGSGFWGGAADDGKNISRAILTNMTIMHNDTGVFNEHSGLMELYNVTIAENSDTGLFNAERGQVSITNSTISSNGWTNIGTETPLTLTNTILSNAGQNCWGPIIDGGNNLDSGNNCSFDTSKGSLINTDPKLDPHGLKDNGGPTQTIALQTDSPALDNGNYHACMAAEVNEVDQRGVTRVSESGTCDIGAFEPVARTYAVLSDYGTANANEQSVEDLINTWDPAPDFIVTNGDNYARTDVTNKYDTSVGKYYCRFLAGVTPGPNCPASQQSQSGNKFFPTLGNHDYSDGGTTSNLPTTYTNYFSLPGNERYYDFVRGPVHFFVVNSNNGTGQEPDGTTASSTQGTWLQTRLAASTSRWNIVHLHHSPYSSGPHASNSWMQWPFAAWGADAVISGHDHIYERIALNDIRYFVNGTGGQDQYSYSCAATRVNGSEICIDYKFGAQRVTATDTGLTFEYITTDGMLMDTFTIGTPPSTTTLITMGSTYKYLDNGSNQGTAWKEAGFDDTRWAQGPAQLGYGDGDEQTVVSYGPNANNKYVTTYFRRTFTVSDPSQFTSLVLKLLRDDGAVVYLNGTELARSNMPAGAIAYTTLAAATVGGTDESTFYSYAVSPNQLHTGENVLAVEIHQSDVTSSDISFDLELKAQ